MEIRLAGNYGPHTKYYPFLEVTETFSAPLVTADDDILYPLNWLERLVQAFRECPEVVNCYRARVAALQSDGLARYELWQMCQSMEASFQHVATGVSGVIYPPQLLAALKNAGQAFEHCCPVADDIWLHVQALRAGYKVRQFVPKALHFPTLPGTQEIALQQSNVSGPDAGNDRQARLTYSKRDFEKMSAIASLH